MVPPPRSGRAQTETDRHARPIRASEDEKHVLSARRDGAADEEHVAWSAAMRRAATSTALTAASLAHEGARRAGDLVDDRDVAGDEVGQLGEKEGRRRSLRAAC
jgi:hypothetical protein